MRTWISMRSGAEPVASRSLLGRTQVARGRCDTDEIGGLFANWTKCAYITNITNDRKEADSYGYKHI